mmetsp:Transcript_30370/g.58384  ORF Transcript_30370/g.58384 Transcript_30370/m.58384 type:complete len:291 (-) Transcript_30370:409-1281(-)
MVVPELHRDRLRCPSILILYCRKACAVLDKKLDAICEVDVGGEHERGAAHVVLEVYGSAGVQQVLQDGSVVAPPGGAHERGESAGPFSVRLGARGQEGLDAVGVLHQRGGSPHVVLGLGGGGGHEQRRLAPLVDQVGVRAALQEHVHRLPPPGLRCPHEGGGARGVALVGRRAKLQEVLQHVPVALPRGAQQSGEPALGRPRVRRRPRHQQLLRRVRVPVDGGVQQGCAPRPVHYGPVSPVRQQVPQNLGVPAVRRANQGGAVCEVRIARFVGVRALAKCSCHVSYAAFL